MLKDVMEHNSIPETCYFGEVASLYGRDLTFRSGWDKGVYSHYLLEAEIVQVVDQGAITAADIQYAHAWRHLDPAEAP